MPKVLSSLYNHNARNAVARQLNISVNASGRSSYSYKSSQVELDATTPQPHVCHERDAMEDVAMFDIDENYTASHDDINNQDSQIGKVVPGVKAIIKNKGEAIRKFCKCFIYSLNKRPNSLIAWNDAPLTTWVKYRDEYLDECMTLEGRGPFFKYCSGCRAELPSYRCKDCMVGPLWCKECLLQRHDQSPLHNVEVLLSMFLFLAEFPFL